MPLVPISINVSPSQFAHGDIHCHLAEQIDSMPNLQSVSSLDSSLPCRGLQGGCLSAAAEPPIPCLVALAFWEGVFTSLYLAVSDAI